MIPPELRLKRASHLGRSHGKATGATTARRAVKGVGTLLAAAGSLAILGVGVVVLSAVSVLILWAVSALVMVATAGVWMLLFSLTSSQAEHLVFVLLPFVALVLIRRFRRSLPPPSGKGPLPR